MARKMLVDGEAPVADAGQYDYDLFVIGAGSGGVRGSRTAASFGAKVGYFPTSVYSSLDPPLPCRRMIVSIIFETVGKWMCYAAVICSRS